MKKLLFSLIIVIIFSTLPVMALVDPYYEDANGPVYDEIWYKDYAIESVRGKPDASLTLATIGACEGSRTMSTEEALDLQTLVPNTTYCLAIEYQEWWPVYLAKGDTTGFAHYSCYDWNAKKSDDVWKGGYMMGTITPSIPDVEAHLLSIVPSNCTVYFDRVHFENIGRAWFRNHYGGEDGGSGYWKYDYTDCLIVYVDFKVVSTSGGGGGGVGEHL